MDVKLVASDLDGTLLRSDGTLDERSARTLSALRAAGIPCVVCTARPARWLASLEAATGTDGHAVCANGALVWDLAAGEALESSPIAPAAARQVVDRLRAEFPEGAWAAEWVDRYVHEPGYVPKWPVPDDTLVGPLEQVISQPVLKLLLRAPADSADALLARAHELAGGLVEMSHSSSDDILLEMSAAGVSKASGLAHLCDRLGIGAEHVIAFGDMPNDLPMLRWAGEGVAVANAHPEVLAAADAVTTSNEEGGVSSYLERLLPALLA